MKWGLKGGISIDASFRIDFLQNTYFDRPPGKNVLLLIQYFSKASNHSYVKTVEYKSIISTRDIFDLDILKKFGFR